MVTYPGVEAVEGHPTMLFFTSGDMVEDDPETFSAMSRAINTALDYANENPDELRQAAVDGLGVDAALVEDVRLEDFGGPVRTEQIQQMADLMEKFGFVNEAVDVDGMLQSVEQD